MFPVLCPESQPVAVDGSDKAGIAPLPGIAGDRPESSLGERIVHANDRDNQEQKEKAFHSYFGFIAHKIVVGKAKPALSVRDGNF
jgi:hypothetical protein